MEKNIEPIEISTVVHVPADIAWHVWTAAAHIMQWNHASPDWHCPAATNDCRAGGKFSYTMAAKDGSFSFDFSGEYTIVEPDRFLAYTMADGRQCSVRFEHAGAETKIVEIFDPEQENTRELQRDGWQAILNNYAAHAERFNTMVTLHFETHIAVPPATLYAIMIAQETYPAWTKVFSPGSTFIGSWEEGSHIRFVAGDDRSVAMYSCIAVNKPNQQIIIEHLGVEKDGVLMTNGPEIKPWAGAKEVYVFLSESGGTRLLVDMDTNLLYKAYFENTWPEALVLLKELAEA